jgi:hypothetical protein
MSIDPIHVDEHVTVHHGDCRTVLADLPAESVDAIVTDPPYELGFMAKSWDSAGVAFDPETWAACLRVLKPGGHLLAFGATRTYHRLTCAIEDAGFGIRDSLHWITGQGFPKSLNVNKDARFCQCDLGELPNGDGELRRVRQAVPDVPGLAEESEVADLFATVQREGAGARLGEARPQGCGGTEDDARTQVRSGQSCLEGRGDVQAAEGELHRPEVRPLPAGANGHGQVGRLHHGAPAHHGPVDRAPALADGVREPQGPQPSEQRPIEPGAVSVERGSQARRGWPVCGGCGKPSIPPGLGTALRPAHEPIVLARKPLAGTVVATVLAHGTGALNVDGCRVAALTPQEVARSGKSTNGGVYGEFDSVDWKREGKPHPGRWPANVVLTHPPALDAAGDVVGDACADGCVDGCPVAEMDAQSGVRTSGSRKAGTYGLMGYMGADAAPMPAVKGDSGGASRFFPVFRYQAKAPKRERPRLADGTTHPTVKPVALMRWLVRLVTPPGGVVVDPFLGSGTTAEACVAEGFRCVGVELEEAHLPLIKARLAS